MLTIMKWLGAATVVVLCSCDFVLSVRRTPIIEISQGKLRGVVALTHNKYLGIPYATVEKRFQAPGDPPKWSDIFDADHGGRTCKQYLSRFGFPIGREDCLVLNVYTPPDARSKKPLPVMVFIHGGGFYWGGSSSLLYEPEPLVAKGAVVVTINYRLGAFGFLCLGIDGAPGNAGLKDQVAALRWVNQNIKYFGGEPKSVTLFGESAGAASVHFLVLSRMSKGLFHKAILESGSALSPWAFATDSVERASEVAERLGFKTKDPKEILEVFRNASATAIVMATDAHDFTEKYIFRPCPEKRFPKVEQFLTKTPNQILTSGIYNKVPMIIGYNNKEGIRYAGMQSTESLAEYDANFEKLLPDDLYFETYEDKKRVAENVKRFYFGNKTVNWNSIGGLIDFFSDTYFHVSCVRSSELHLNTSQHPVFNYYFKYDSLRNLGKFVSRLPTQPGASHTDELFYIFQPGFWLVPLVGKDRTMVNRMTQLWTNFAKQSNPTPSPSVLLPVAWSANNSSARLDFYTLDETMGMRAQPNPQRIQFWRDIYGQFGTKD